MEYIFKIMPSLLDGAKVSLEVFLITLILSIPLGLLTSLARVSKIKIFNYISGTYVLIMRGTPLLLQLIVIFFGLPIIGISLDRFLAAIIAFVLNYGAYFCEIFRAGMEDIEKGQYEACEILGFNRWYILKNIIIPQTIKKVLPAITNEIITLMKDTSLVYVVGIGELLRAGKIMSNKDASLMPLVLVGIVYLILISVLSRLLKKLELKFNYYS